jgi:hypothetical protein
MDANVLIKHFLLHMKSIKTLKRTSMHYAVEEVDNFLDALTRVNRNDSK